MTPDLSALFAAGDETWPPAEIRTSGIWRLRRGNGGGNRVSAASTTAIATEADINVAENEMLLFDQKPLFSIRDGNEALDQKLASRGYVVRDPTNLWTLPVAALTDIPIPRVTAFAIWEPLAIMTEIWATGGIGPERIDVMGRAKRKTGILARWNERPAGVGFVAASGGIAMVHAVQVLPSQRQQGVASWIMRKAAFWARDQGAETLAVLCTQANTAGTRLYSALGFEKAGQYHYRQKPIEGASGHG
jgi:GNAT superfamily N-acetyltransferase